MSPAAAHARHLTLRRLERAAGQAFGCPDDAWPAPGPRRGAVAAVIAVIAVLAPALVVLAAAVAALAAMLAALA